MQSGDLKEMKKTTNNKIYLLLLFTVLTGGLISGLYLVQNRQIFENKAVGPMCPEFGASCSWDSLGPDTQYLYEITDETFGFIVSEGLTQKTSIPYTPILNHSYKCTVAGVNTCGQGPTQDVLTSCVSTTNDNSHIGAAGINISPAVTITPYPSTITPFDFVSPTSGADILYPTEVTSITASPSAVTEEPGSSPIVQMTETGVPQEELSPTRGELKSGTQTGSKILIILGLFSVLLALIFIIIHKIKK